MSLRYTTMVSCWRCMARIEVTTDPWTSKLVEKVLKPCTCTGLEVEERSEFDLPMSGSCEVCGGPCRSIAKRCTPCNVGAVVNREKVRYQARKKCKDCGAEINGHHMRRYCDDCGDRRDAESKRASYLRRASPTPDEPAVKARLKPGQRERMRRG